MSKYFIFILLIISCNNSKNNIAIKEPFYWGVATAAYQVEGAYKSDGKGESKWDFLTNTIGITQMVIGQKMTGNVAINMYDRAQYLKDIDLMKKLGVNSYRFSLDWSRIIPDGIGKPNEIALKHYDVLLDDLIAAGIEPFVTIYHFDFPNVLLKQGGWGNPNMKNWYLHYAKTVIDRYGKKVNKFITFNEPYIEFFLVENLLTSDPKLGLSKEKYMSQMQKFHLQMMTNAEIIQYYHGQKLSGEIGLVMNINPGVPMDSTNVADEKAAAFQDLLINNIVLDPMYKGTYPKMVTDSLAKYNPTFVVRPEELKFINTHKPDFLGLNFYAPAMVYGKDSPMSLKWLDNNPDKVKSGVGPVKPEYLYQMIMRLKKDYGNPQMYITENGAGFGSEDIVIDGKVNDALRTDYIKRHIDWSLKAKKEGANLGGYMVWSGWDNFEWVSGYTKRLGLIHVDFKTQKRTPKQSYYEYQKIIKTNKDL